MMDLQARNAVLEHILTNGQVRDGIMGLQQALSALPQSDFPLIHHWADNSYGREIFIRKGSLLVGKIHKHSHLNIISMGDVTVVTEFGLERMKAPKTFVSLPGTKRALYAHEDTIWTTVHVTDKKTVEEAEEELIAKDYAEYDKLAFERNLSLALGNGPTVDGVQVNLREEEDRLDHG
jgi:hypothetical protein